MNAYSSSHSLRQQNKEIAVYFCAVHPVRSWTLNVLHKCIVSLCVLCSVWQLGVVVHAVIRTPVWAEHSNNTCTDASKLLWLYSMKHANEQSRPIAMFVNVNIMHFALVPPATSPVSSTSSMSTTATANVRPLIDVAIVHYHRYPAPLYTHNITIRTPVHISVLISHQWFGKFDLLANFEQT